MTARFFLLITGLFLLFSQSIKSQSPDWAWCNNAGKIGVGGFGSIASDNDGNVYMANGFASASISFGNITLTNYSWNLNSTFCLVKYDSSGNVLWAKTAHGDFNYIKTSKVEVDNYGNVYVTGVLMGDSIVFDNLVFNKPNSVPGLIENMFLIKFSTNGDVLWGKTADGNNTFISGKCNATGLALDANGNCYVTGNFSAKKINFSQDTLLNSFNGLGFSHDIYIAKFDSSGNVLWAKNVSQTNKNENGANDIVVDENGIYVTGSFTGTTISFGGFTLTNSEISGHFRNLFITKHDTSGNVIWAQSNATDGNSDGTSLAIATNGLLYLTGNFSSEIIVFDNDTLINQLGGFSNSYYNIFSAALNTSGTVIWAKSAVQTYNATINDCAVDSQSNLYIVGNHAANDITFDQTKLYNQNGYNEIFVTKYDSSGNVLWAKSVGGDYQDFGRGITATTNGDVYITGTFSSRSIEFGGIVINANIAPGGANDIFVAKLSGQCTPATIIQQPQDQSSITGQTATFNVVATGSPIIKYQWYVNGYPIYGANSASFTTPVLESHDNNTTFHCNVSNCSYSNTVPTTSHLLEVCTVGSFNVFLTNSSLALGDSAVFITHFLEGSPPFVYRWFKNGILIPNATDSFYITPPLTANDNGSIFSCKVENCNGLGVSHSDHSTTFLLTSVYEKTNRESNTVIYPNPVVDILNIHTDKLINDESVISILNVNGQELIKYPLKNRSIQIDMSKLVSGIYIIKLVTGKTVEVGNVVKK